MLMPLCPSSGNKVTANWNTLHVSVPCVSGRDAVKRTAIWAPLKDRAHLNNPCWTKNASASPPVPSHLWAIEDPPKDALSCAQGSAIAAARQDQWLALGVHNKRECIVPAELHTHLKELVHLSGLVSGDEIRGHPGILSDQVACTR